MHLRATAVCMFVCFPADDELCGIVGQTNIGNELAQQLWLTSATNFRKFMPSHSPFSLVLSSHVAPCCRAMWVSVDCARRRSITACLCQTVIYFGWQINQRSKHIARQFRTDRFVVYFCVSVCVCLCVVAVYARPFV